MIKNNDTDCIDEIKELEDNLKQCEVNEWKKAQIRTHSNQKEEGEKASKDFLNLERQQIQTLKIGKLLNNNLFVAYCFSCGMSN